MVESAVREDILRIVRDRDVAPEASRDGFTAVLRMSSRTAP
jgi:hypothetical protein